MADIRYFNRYADALQTEAVYGDSYLRWIYSTHSGRFVLWLLARRIFFSRWYGRRMNRRSSAAKIEPFIEHYGVDTSEFLEPVSSYRTFNDFFYRKLKETARPISGGEDTALLPADGRHLGIVDVAAADGVYAKGQHFSLGSLLGDAALAKRFAGGTAVISRLCPMDYHRFHAPVSGRIVEQRLINGWLYSVSPIALRRNVSYLWENKRVLSLIDSEPFGEVAFVAIGATCVGSIRMTAREGAVFQRGDELGYFAFGGSCVVTLFKKGRIALESDLATRGAEQVEVYARVRDALGRHEAGR